MTSRTVSSGGLEGGFGDLAEHVVLASHPFEVLDELLAALLLGAGVYAVHGRDQELDQHVGDLSLSQEK